MSLVFSCENCEIPVVAPEVFMKKVFCLVFAFTENLHIFNNPHIIVHVTLSVERIDM